MSPGSGEDRTSSPAQARPDEPGAESRPRSPQWDLDSPPGPDRARSSGRPIKGFWEGDFEPRLEQVVAPAKDEPERFLPEFAGEGVFRGVLEVAAFKDGPHPLGDRRQRSPDF